MTATAEAVSGDSIKSVEIYNGAAAFGAATQNGDGTWSFTASGLAAGQTYDFVATATDAAGNSGSYALAPVTVAAQAPTVSASESVLGVTNQTSDTITVSATSMAGAGDSITGVEIYNGTTDLGPATLSGGTWSYTASGLADGQTYNFIAKATDSSGFTASASLAAVTVATQAPTVSATGSLSGVTNQTSDTFTVSASAEAVGGDSITGVEIYNGTTALGAATSSGAGTWILTASGLADGAYDFVATATDAAGNSASYALPAVTVATKAPTVSAAESVSGVTNQTSDTFTVSASAEAVGSNSITAVEIFSGSTDLGQATSSGAGTWTFTANGLSPGQMYNFSAMAMDAAGNTATTSLAPVTVVTALTAITSESYSGGHWILTGTAAAGSTVTLSNGSTLLGTTIATAGGTWSFTTALNNGAIRVFTATETIAGITSPASAPIYLGTNGNDVFAFASESAVSAAALINGGAGTDTLQLTSPATLTDADFAYAQSTEILGLNGASVVTLGGNASKAGIGTVVTGNGATSITDTNSGTLTVNAAALGAGNMLTLAGPTAMTVTGLTGNLNAAGDSGALTVTATGAAAQTIATGSGPMSIADSAAGGSVTVDATALGTNYADALRLGGEDGQ